MMHVTIPRAEVEICPIELEEGGDVEIEIDGITFETTIEDVQEDEDFDQFGLQLEVDEYGRREE